MLKQLNIKKEYGLVAASILLLLVAYQFASKRTIEAWHLRRDLKRQLQQSGDLSYQPGYLERKNGNLDKVLNLYSEDTINYRSNVLSSISSIAEQENVKLSEVPALDPMNRTGLFTIQKLSFEGDYFTLLKTLDKLQSATGIGITRSAILRFAGGHSTADDNKKIIMDVYLEVAVK